MTPGRAGDVSGVRPLQYNDSTPAPNRSTSSPDRQRTRHARVGDTPIPAEPSSRPSWSLLLAALLAVSPTSGCGPSQAGRLAYLPTPELARAALVASLTAWRDGHPGGPAAVGGVPVEVSDSYRDPARPLRAFEILGPSGVADERGFAVRLTLANPVESSVASYLVVGRDPVWVFRREDYERIAHWEHKMEGDEGDTPAPAATGDGPAHPRTHPDEPEPSSENPR